MVLCKRKMWFPGADAMLAPKVRINPLVVELAVLNWRKSLTFYTDLLDFGVVFDRTQEGFAFLQRDDAQLMLYQANLERNLVVDDAPLTPPLGRGMNVQIQVARVEPIIQVLKSASIPFVLDPEERSYRAGDITLVVRQFAVADPDGYVIRLTERIA